MRPLAYCCYRAWGMLEELVAAYQVPLGQVLQPRIPGGAGKKDNERSRERQRMDRPPRDVSKYGEFEIYFKKIPILVESFRNLH